MKNSGSLGKACRTARCGASCKRRNDADGPEFFTRDGLKSLEKNELGRAILPAPRRANRLARGQNRRGQMIQYYRDML